MNIKNNYCAGVATTFKVTHRLLRHSILPHLRIKFTFSFKIEHFYILDTEYSPTPLFIECCPSDDSSSATVHVGAILSFKDVAEAVVRGVGNRLTDDKSRELIVRAWEEIREEFPPETRLPRLKTLDLGFDVKIKHHHLFVKRYRPRSLEKHRGGGGDDEERCCCICLQELGGGGGGGEFWMPCSHVFHDGCVKEWLRRSRTCPLCRYETRCPK
ncbi:uncharacterized protein LOC131012500 [Salvia miltiorrhiza]|uniref:uncharacterized protein LOC131012500 n=1 Tax=Salvia miltiorrhiza TaxID=226208 RepID=UPI0025ACD1A9|nr:uncharacterized protein LOC131012500 [Salvia miltiorrhiza]